MSVHCAIILSCCTFENFPSKMLKTKSTLQQMSKYGIDVTAKSILHYFGVILKRKNLQRLLTGH